MDITTIKILVLAVVALLILAALVGEFWPRQRTPRPPVGRLRMVRQNPQQCSPPRSPSPCWSPCCSAPRRHRGLAARRSSA